METVSATAYLKDVEQRERLEDEGRLSEAQSIRLEIDRRRAENLEVMVGVLGSTLHKANDNSDLDPRIAAMATREGETVAMTPFLDHASKDEARKVAEHEKGHLNHFRRGIFAIDLEEHLGKARVQTLNRSLGIKQGKKIEDVNLLEGLTEFLTAQQCGTNHNCAYNYLEVPAVKALEALSRKYLGQSLVAAYQQSLTLFYDFLERICDRLDLEDFLRGLPPEEIARSKAA